TAHTDELLDAVVPRRDVGIAKRPIDPVSIALVRFEIQIAPAIAVTSPQQRAPADDVGPQPVVRLARRLNIWVLAVVVPEMYGRGIECARVALDVVIAGVQLAIDEIVIRQIPRRHVLGRVTRTML